MMRLLKTVNTKFNWKSLEITFAATFAILLLLVITSESKIFFGILLGINSLIFLRRIELLFYAVIAFSLIFIIYWICKQSTINQVINQETKVIEINGVGPIVQIKNTRVQVDYSGHLNVGDIINVSGWIKQVHNESNNFDLISYLKSQNVFNIIYQPKVEIVSRLNSIFTLVHNFVNEKSKPYSSLVPLILFGEKNLNTKEFYNTALQLNVLHLFVISGFHISLVHLLLTKLLTKWRLKKIYAEFIPFLPIIIYLFFLNFPISATRAAIFMFLFFINKNYLNKKFFSLDILAFTAIIVLIWKPLSVYSISYIFSFIATYAILIAQNIKYVKKSNRKLIIPLVAYFSNILISIHLNNFFAPLGLIWGIVLAPFFIVMYVFTLFLFPCEVIMKIPCTGFNWIMNQATNLNYLLYVGNTNLKVLFGVYGFAFSVAIILETCDYIMEKNHSWSIVRSKLK